MHRTHAATTLVFAVLCLTRTLAQEGAAPLSPEEMEAFLLNAELSDYRVVDIGVTGSQRATASDGDLAHDVHIQVVDQRRRVAAGEINFRDFYLYNVAAYRVAVLLGLDNVPMSVRRNVRGQPAAVTWWVDDVAMDEAERMARGTFGPDPAGTYQQLYTMYVFDELLKNVDRNQGNVLWTSDWKMWLIDHTRAFRLDDELSRPELMTRIGADLLERLRGLTAEELEEAVGDSLTGAERGSLMRRRDVLVQHFDELIEQRGAAAVLMAPLPAQEPAARPAQTAQVVEVGQTGSVQSVQADQPAPAVQPEPAVQTSPLVGAAPLEPDQPEPVDPSEPAGQPEPAAQTLPPGQPAGAAPPEPDQPEQGALQPELERAIALIEEGDFAAAADLLEAFTSGPVGEQRLSSEAREMVLAYLYYGIARLYLAGDDDARRAFQDAQRLDPAYEPEASALPRRVVELWQEVRNLGALIVITTPDAATVYVDGEMRGYAPVDVAMLAPGDYRVTVTREGYLDDTRVVTVVSGGESTIVVEMAPAEAELAAVEEAAAGATGGTGQPATPPAVGGGGGLGTGAIAGIAGAAGAAVGLGVAVGGGGDPPAPTPTPRPDPPASAPSAPSAPRLSAGDGQLVATWTAPSDNGSRIDDYDVRYRPSGGGWTELPDGVKSTSTTATITGLRNGTSYEVQVRAGNSVGDGPWSASARATPVASASVPSAPSSPRLSAGDGELVASWTAPSDNGSRIDDYDVRYRSSGGGWTELPDGVKSTSTTATITGLRNGTSYEVQVRAGNSVGDGPWSASSTATPVASASIPSAPSAPRLSAGDGQLVASWTAPSDNGSRIDDYDVRYRPSGGGWTELPDEAKSTATTATITGLRNGTSYEVQVRAGNSVGDGPWSASSTATPVASASVPSAPSAPRLSAGDGELVASWTAPSDNGSRIDDYDVRYRPSGGGWTELPDEAKSTATTATITGLRNGTSYEVQVRAGNSVGDGPWSASATATPVASIDRVVLMELYDATNGSNWINNTNWNTDAPLGEWHGVSTGADGRVSGLDLQGNQLSGSIPSSLGSLHNLLVLHLRQNELNGSIPSSLGSLNNLQRLGLQFNELTGPIPSSLGSLTNLHRLDLGHNQLTGSIPSLSSLTRLTYLRLAGNELTGPIPSWLGSLTDLQHLNLQINQLTGPIPSSLGSLTNLRRLILDGNPLGGQIPSWLGNLTNLRELWLYRTRLSGPIPSSLGSLTNLTELRLVNNELSGPIPSSLGSLTNLTELRLANNELSGPIPSELGNLRNLERLGLDNNRLTGSIPAALCKFDVNPQQGDVYLPGCRDSDEDRAALVDFYNTTNGANWRGDTNWNSSEPLNRWRGVGTDENGRVAVLRLASNELSGSIPSSLSSLTKLEILDLDANYLTGSIPPSLSGLANLRVLRLWWNELSGSIPAALCKFENRINPQRGGVDLPCETSGGASVLGARLVPGDGRLTVEWAGPSEDGGEIDDYDVRYRPESADGAAGVWTELPDETKNTATSAAITGLSNGTVYAVQVRTGSASGDGAWSPSVRAAPTATPESLSFGGARIEDQRWQQYTAIAVLELPAATGGEGAVTYGLSPELPAGLVFDAAARTVSGAATKASAPAAYTYTATDASGVSASLGFTLEVEVSPEESALRRDALAAQGRALLSSVTGVIGERFRARPSSDGEARGGAGGLVQGLASMLGLRAGRTFGGGAGTATGAAGLPGLRGLGPVGHAAMGGLGSGGHAGMGGSRAFPGAGPVAGPGGSWALDPGGGPGGHPVLGGGLAGGHLGTGSPGGLVGASAFGSAGFEDAARGLGPLAPGMGAGGWNDLVWGQSFAAPLSVGEDGGGVSRYTVWGAGDRQSFSGSPAAGRYSGDMRSLYVGADRRLGADWLAGAALGRSWGSADYQASVDGASAGRLTTLLTSVYPYVRGRVSRSLELWAVGGYGRGSAADARAGGAPGAPGGLRMTMGAAGLRQDVLERGGMALAVVGGMGSLSLSSSGGGLTLSGLGAGVHQGRLAVEASRASGAVSPFVQFGGRYDGGDGETGAGVELVAGLRASTSRVDLEARGRWLTVHSASGYSEYGAMARLAVKSRADGTGLQATLSPRWGMAEELRFDDGGMLGAAGVSRLGRGGAWTASGQALSLEGEVGYGWRSRRLRGVMSPLTSYRRTGFGGDLTQLGFSYLSSEALWGDLRMQFTLGRERWYEQTAGYRAAVTVASVF